MAFCIYETDTLQSSDPYLYSKKIILSHPNVTHALIITEFESPYSPNWNNFLKSDERSLTGSLGISGGTRSPVLETNVDCVLTKQQLNLLIELKRKQDALLIPITIQDKFEKIVYISGIMNEPSWLSGYPVTNNLGQPEGFAAFTVWLDFDANYQTYRGAETYLVQFQIKVV